MAKNNYYSIARRLIHASRLDAKSFAEAKLSTSCYEVGDLVEEAEAIISTAKSPIVCEACRSDVRQYPTVGFGRVAEFDPRRPNSPIVLGWFRLCERCYARGVAEDDPRDYERFCEGEKFEPFFYNLSRMKAKCREDYLCGYFGWESYRESLQIGLR